MIQDVDETLRQMLTANLAQIDGCAFKDPSQVTFTSPDLPDAGSEDGPRLNLFFYNIQENRSLRDDTFHRVSQRSGENQAGRKRAPVCMDLSYLVTVHAAGGAAEEHRLLAETIGVLLQYDSIPPQYRVGALKDQSENAVRIAVAQPDHSAHANPAALWQALGGKMRPAIGLTVTIPFDPFGPRWTRVVREVVLGLGPAFPPDAASRPLELSGVRVSVVGLVTNENDGLPLAGVAVTIGERDVRAMTDARGCFYFLNLPTRTYTLQFSKRGMDSCTAAAVAPAPNRSDELMPVLVQMRPMAPGRQVDEEVERVEAQLRDTELVETERVCRVSQSGKLTYSDGRAAAYIPVRVGDQRTLTDAAGVYTFFNLPPGEHPVIVEIISVAYIDTPGGESEPAMLEGGQTRSDEVKPAAPLVKSRRRS